ncbi:hypothetical protein RCL1_008060 [Eukaryota sp. TZLM3-RCL]
MLVKVLVLTCDGLPLFSYATGDAQPLVFPGVGLLHAFATSLDDNDASLHYISCSDTITLFNHLSPSKQGIRFCLSIPQTDYKTADSILTYLTDLFTCFLGSLLDDDRFTSSKIERIKTTLQNTIGILDFIFNSLCFSFSMFPFFLSSPLSFFSVSSSYFSSGSRIRDLIEQCSSELSVLSSSVGSIASIVYSDLKFLTKNVESWPIILSHSRGLNLSKLTLSIISIVSCSVSKKSSFSIVPLKLSNSQYFITITVLSRNNYLVNVFNSKNKIEKPQELLSSLSTFLSTSFKIFDELLGTVTSSPLTFEEISIKFLSLSTDCLNLTFISSSVDDDVASINFDCLSCSLLNQSFSMERNGVRYLNNSKLIIGFDSFWPNLVNFELFKEVFKLLEDKKLFV